MWTCCPEHGPEGPRRPEAAAPRRRRCARTDAPAVVIRAATRRARPPARPWNRIRGPGEGTRARGGCANAKRPPTPGAVHRPRLAGLPEASPGPSAPPGPSVPLARLCCPSGHCRSGHEAANKARCRKPRTLWPAMPSPGGEPHTGWGPLPASGTSASTPRLRAAEVAWKAPDPQAPAFPEPRVIRGP